MNLVVLFTTAVGKITVDVPGDLSQVDGFDLYDGDQKIDSKTSADVVDGKLTFDVSAPLGAPYDYYLRERTDSNHATGTAGQ